MIPKDVLQSSRQLIELAFHEDLGERGDITSAATAPPDLEVSARIVSKQVGRLAGIEIAKQAFISADPQILFKPLVKDGDRLIPRQNIATVTGSASAILRAERTALNFLGRLSGIATATAALVEAVRGTNAKILDTRKTLPGWRILEKYAVTCGDGVNHRTGLYDMFLIKENHIASAGSITNAVKACRNYIKTMDFWAPIEVETQNLDQVKEALEQAVDRIMLDNMTPAKLSKCVEWVNGRIPLEASGNVSICTVKQIAASGVDFISVGGITHSAQNFDFSLLL